jgi:hypothetical protein
VAAVKKGRMARVKKCERYISAKQLKQAAERRRGPQGLQDMGDGLGAFIRV